MLARISLQLANNRGRYSHFIHKEGTIAALKKLEELHEARVGVLVEVDYPTEAQYEAIDLLAPYVPQSSLCFRDSKKRISRAWDVAPCRFWCLG